MIFTLNISIHDSNHLISNINVYKLEEGLLTTQRKDGKIPPISAKAKSTLSVDERHVPGGNPAIGRLRIDR
jgi:hypothetical protein